VAAGEMVACVCAMRGWGVSSVGVLLAISVTVSVKAQKYGGLCDHPIRRLKGRVMRGSTPWSVGRTTAKCRAAVALMGTL